MRVLGPRHLSTVGAALAALAAPCAVLAQTPPATFPASLDREAMIAWLRKETDIAPNAVLAISPSTLTSLLSTRPGSEPDSYRVVIRSEALSPEAAKAWLSSNASLEIDCRTKKLKSGAVTGYAERNLFSTPKPLKPADATWRTPPRGGELEQVMKAVCEKSFQRPLAGGPVVNAQAATSPPVVPVPAARAAEARPRPAPQAQAKAPSASAATARATPAVARVSRAAVQISASDTPAEAQRALEAFRGKFGDRIEGLETRVAKAVVGGKTYHRALIEGFGSVGDAQTMCGSLKSAGQECFVRPGS